MHEEGYWKWTWYPLMVWSLTEWGKVTGSIWPQHPPTWHIHTIWKVNRIIHKGNWTLTVPSLSPIWHSISSFRISDMANTWRWKANSSGDFSFASAWDVVRVSCPPIVAHNVVWFLPASPKMSCCLLKGLLTGYQLYPGCYNLRLLILTFVCHALQELKQKTIYTLNATS